MQIISCVLDIKQYEMFFKVTLVALFVATVSASGGYSSFSYGVSDPNTGDVKNQHEKRVGDSVVGQYSLLESDGTKRVVDYSANPHTGFNAVVRKDPVAVHPAPVAAHPQVYGAASLYNSGLGYSGYNNYATPYSYSHTPTVSAYSSSVSHGNYGHGYGGLSGYSSPVYGGSYGGYNGYSGLGLASPVGYSGYSGLGLGAHSGYSGVGLASPVAQGYSYGGYSAGYGAGYGHGSNAGWW